MTLHILLVAMKLLAQINSSKYIKKKHGRLVLENVRSLDKIKCKYKDINLIKTYQKEDRKPTFAKVKLAIKSGNKKIQQKITRIIITQKHREKCKLKREIIQLAIIGLVLFNGVIYSHDKSIKQKSVKVTKRHEKNLVKLRKDKRLTFSENIKYIRHTMHNFSSYQLSSNEEEALSFGLDEHVPNVCN